MSDEPLKIDFTPAPAPAPPHDDDVPELRESDALDLPEGARLNPDGTVTVTFEEPATIVFRPLGGGDRIDRTYTELTLKRLKGQHRHRIIAATPARRMNLMLSLSCGVSEAELALLYPVMDAPDLTVIRLALSALTGTDQDGLPANAEKQDDGSYVLPLAYPATDGDGVTHTAVTLRKLKAQALIAMQNGKDTLLTGLAIATGLTPKSAGVLLDDMDAVDVNAVERVIGFLSGSGRRNGG